MRPRHCVSRLFCTRPGPSSSPSCLQTSRPGVLLLRSRAVAFPLLGAGRHSHRGPLVTRSNTSPTGDSSSPGLHQQRCPCPGAGSTCSSAPGHITEPPGHVASRRRVRECRGMSARLANPSVHSVCVISLAVRTDNLPALSLARSSRCPLWGGKRTAALMCALPGSRSCLSGSPGETLWANAARSQCCEVRVCHVLYAPRIDGSLEQYSIVRGQRPPAASPLFQEGAETAARR